jgi:hypothetical protein
MDVDVRKEGGCQRWMVIRVKEKWGMTASRALERLVRSAGDGWLRSPVAT